MMRTTSYVERAQAGLATQQQPKVDFATVIGRSKRDDREIYVGEVATEQREALDTSCPMDKGVITNWDDMVPIWKHAFERLNVTPSESSVLLTDIIFNTDENREKMTEVMFERVHAAGVCIASAPYLSMYASKKTSGLLIKFGDIVTHLVPYIKGRPLLDKVTQFDISGHDITKYLENMLKQQQFEFEGNPTQESENMKEQYAYVAEDFILEMNKFNHKMESNYCFHIHNGGTLKREVVYGAERFLCTESMFRPDLVGLHTSGIHELIQSTILSCEEPLHKKLFSNIILSGGTPTLKGFVDRLQNELESIATHDHDIQIEPSHGKYQTFIGGTMLIASSDYSNMLISKRDYLEHGTALVHKRFAR